MQKTPKTSNNKKEDCYYYNEGECGNGYGVAAKQNDGIQPLVPESTKHVSVMLKQ
jgi:hypothetical protein